VTIGKREVKVGPRTLEKIHVTLHKALDVAIGWRLVTMNPTDYVERPKYRTPKVEAIGGESVGAFLKAIRGDRYEALYELALFCGLQSGEIYALKWSDVDLAKRTVTIARIVARCPARRRSANARRLRRAPPRSRCLNAPSMRCANIERKR